MRHGSDFPRYYLHALIISKSRKRLHRYSWIFLLPYGNRSQCADCADDFAPLTEPSLDPANAGLSAVPSLLGVTGGEYKLQEHIHRRIADRRLLAIPAS